MPAKISHEQAFQNLLNRLDTSGICWQWTGPKTKDGYGQYRHRSFASDKVHRNVWLEIVGEIPEGMHLDHLCRNRSCANPDHLEIVTPHENFLRGQKGYYKNRSHCSNGHEFTEENVYISPGDGKRVCRICDYNWRTARRKKAAEEDPDFYKKYHLKYYKPKNPRT